MKTERGIFIFTELSAASKSVGPAKWECRSAINHTLVGWIDLFEDVGYVVTLARSDTDGIFRSEDLRDIADFLDQLDRGDDAVPEA